MPSFLISPTRRAEETRLSRPGDQQPVNDGCRYSEFAWCSSSYSNGQLRGLRMNTLGIGAVSITSNSIDEFEN